MTNINEDITIEELASDLLHLAEDALVQAANLACASALLTGEKSPHLTLQAEVGDAVITLAIDVPHEGCDLFDEYDDDDDSLVAQNPFGDIAAQEFFEALGIPASALEGMAIQVIVVPDYEDQHADAQADYERVFGGGVFPIALGPGY